MSEHISHDDPRVYQLSDSVEVQTQHGWERGIVMEYHPRQPGSDDNIPVIRVQLLTRSDLLWVPALRDRPHVRPAGNRDSERIDRLIFALKDGLIQ